MQTSICLYWISYSSRLLIPEFGGGNSLKIYQLSRIPLLYRTISHGTLLSSEQVKVSYSEVQGCDPAFCLVSFSWDTKLRDRMITTTKAAHDLHIPDQSLLICEYQVPQTIFTEKMDFRNPRRLWPVGKSGAVKTFLWWRRLRLGNIYAN